MLQSICTLLLLIAVWFHYMSPALHEQEPNPADLKGPYM
jgi:hypothetical protein